MRKITEIIVHCTATRADWWAGKRTSEKVREIKRWHVQDRGWSDIGYHFLIDRDGTVAKGRDIAKDGAHVQGRNKGTIGISLFGGHGSAETDKFAEHYTPQQDAALRNLISDLRGQYGNVPVTGHNQYAAKACPGFHVPSWLAGKPAKAANSDATPVAPHVNEKPKSEHAQPDVLKPATKGRAHGMLGGLILALAAGYAALAAGAREWLGDVMDRLANLFG